MCSLFAVTMEVKDPATTTQPNHIQMCKLYLYYTIAYQLQTLLGLLGLGFDQRCR